jgi:hypothetical protein
MKRLTEKRKAKSAGAIDPLLLGETFHAGIRTDFQEQG